MILDGEAGAVTRFVSLTRAAAALGPFLLRLRAISLVMPGEKV